ncbi:hypothetical protein F4782DRAFT_452157 [Xylaria castorea]|nr:hypothetical protein F4782DRAFT_452157 [Xylaria castorea]
MEWFETPTIQNHLRLHVPDVDWKTDESWKWPFWKFGFKSADVLFNQLHAEFNSIQCAIQDPYGWHLDVCEIANIANDREEFFSLLRKRQDERYAELERVWHKASSLMVGEPSRWDSPHPRKDLWKNFVRISRNFSYDAFVGYFGAYINEEPEPTATLPNDVGHKNECQQRQPSKETDIDGGYEVNSQGAGPEQTHRNIERGEGTRAPKRAATSPNRVIKRQKRPNRAETPNRYCLRRSTRLQQARRKSW